MPCIHLVDNISKQGYWQPWENEVYQCPLAKCLEETSKNR